jgi:hypothetical protein
MKKTTQVQTRHLKAMALALVTVLALLAAPMCAPLCAARTCSSSTTNSERCHGMGTMEAEGSGQFVAPGKTCGAAEFSAVLAKPDEQNVSSGEVRSNSAPVLFFGSHERGFEDSHKYLGNLNELRIHSNLRNSLLLSTILRI